MALRPTAAWSARDQAERHGLGADAGNVHAGAVIGQLDDDLGAFAPQRQADLARLRACRAARRMLGRLDAVHHGIAQQVLEGRQHALQHLPVQFAGAALDDQFGLLAGVGARPGARCATGAAHGAGTSTMRVRISPFCSSVIGATLLLQLRLRLGDHGLEQRWMLATSLAVSASARENCWMDE